jgi:hypothetical protein
MDFRADFENEDMLKKGVAIALIVVAVGHAYLHWE